MLALGKLLVKTPKYLYNVERGRRHWIREIAAWWRHSTHNCDGTFTMWASQTDHLSGALVEGSKARSKVGRITLISRHFCKTTGDFSKCLSPAGCRISHHCHIVAHVSVVLR